MHQPPPPSTPTSPSLPPDDLAGIEDRTSEELAGRAEDLRRRLDRCRRALGRWFVDRQDVVDLMTICAVAQEPLLLVGPPGTAKSELATKFRDALGIPDDEYFEYMLTRFTEPSEVFGPIDVQGLREGRYTRRIRGKLPTARMVFLDEVFKSSSAILNALLTVLNERKFYQDGRPRPVALRILLAATNEIPEHAELDALRDRFTLKAICRPVQETRFLELIDAGLDAHTHRDLRQRPWAEGLASLRDVLEAHRYLTLQMARREEGPGGVRRDRHRYFDEDLLRELRRLLVTLVREDGIFVSDRKVVKLYRLLRARAWLFHGGRVEREDLVLLAHLGDTREELERLAEKVPRLLGIES